jgi:hypothetical protein
MEGINTGFDAQGGVTRWTTEFREDLSALIFDGCRCLDYFQGVTRVSPDGPAISTLADVLRETIGVQADLNVLSAAT